MRKYKLIKKLPFERSPDIGYISTERLGEEGSHYWNHNWFYPEDYPEFWEEIKEYPKIVSFRNTANDVIFHICEDGFYTSCSLDCKIGTFNKEHFLKESHFEIYQVAASETEVFTLGDKVKHPFTDGFDIISKFIICKDPKRDVVGTIDRPDLIGKLVANVGNCFGNCNIEASKLEKAPEVLFVTEDGIEIYEGDAYYFIVEEDKAIIPTAWTLQRHKADANCKKFCPLGKVQFSSYKAAEKYISENKPIYSKKQVKEALEESYFRESYILDMPYCCTDKFRENIFKQKLGL